MRSRDESNGPGANSTMSNTPFNVTIGDQDEPVLFIPQKGYKYRKGVSVVIHSLNDSIRSGVFRTTNMSAGNSRFL